MLISNYGTISSQQTTSGGAKEYGLLTEDSSPSTGANSIEAGWSFTVGASAITVSGLRVKLAANQTVNGHLWDNSGNLLGTISSISALAGTWVEASFASPITLSANTKYVISCWNTSTRYLYNKDNCTYNSKLTFYKGRTTTTQNAFPSTEMSDYVFQVIDIIISA